VQGGAAGFLVGAEHSPSAGQKAICTLLRTLKHLCPAFAYWKELNYFILGGKGGRFEGCGLGGCCHLLQCSGFRVLEMRGPLPELPGSLFSLVLSVAEQVPFWFLSKELLLIWRHDWGFHIICLTSPLGKNIKVLKNI